MPVLHNRQVVVATGSVLRAYKRDLHVGVKAFDNIFVCRHTHNELVVYKPAVNMTSLLRMGREHHP